MLTNEKAIEKLETQISFVPVLKRQKRFSSDFEKWRRDTKVIIENTFGPESSQIKEFVSINYNLLMVSLDSSYEEEFRSGLDKAVALLGSIVEEIREFRQESALIPKRDAIVILDRISAGFHRVVVQLRERHANRNTIFVKDEYDVQDVFHSLLMIDFQDIRKEEWTPSYAGGSSRVDFLLKQENIIIEIKKTRKSLGQREIGEQLLIDIGRYQAHPNCKLLYCFIYDPDNKINNPSGLLSDLNKLHGDLLVKTSISP